MPESSSLISILTFLLRECVDVILSSRDDRDSYHSVFTPVDDQWGLIARPDRLCFRHGFRREKTIFNLILCIADAKEKIMLNKRDILQQVITMEFEKWS